MLDHARLDICQCGLHARIVDKFGNNTKDIGSKDFGHKVITLLIYRDRMETDRASLIRLDLEHSGLPNKLEKEEIFFSEYETIDDYGANTMGAHF